MTAKFNLEMATLRMVKTRENYERYAPMIPPDVVNPETMTIIRRMGEFFNSTEHNKIEHETFWPFLLSHYPKWNAESRELWFKLTRPIDLDNPPGYNETVLSNLLTTQTAGKLTTLIENWQAGKEVDFQLALRETMETFEQNLQRKIRTPDVQFGWEEMIEETESNVGLQWPLPSLGENLRPVREGDSILLAMRPDRGKTSMGAHLMGHMAPQLAELYPGQFRPGIWFNNEGPGRRILSRIRQSVLNLSSEEIEDIGYAEGQRRFVEAMGGREDRIQVLDIHGYSSWEVEELIRKKQPGLVVFDMIDNIRFGGALANNGERNDQVLEAMYQWARVMAVKYGFGFFAMSQLSGEAEGQYGRWPLQGMLKDSRTGKQGACDTMLVGGYDPNMPNTRFLSTPKNKHKRVGKPGYYKQTVFFDQDRARMKELEEQDE